MKKISYSCPKKLISSYRKTFAATAQNKVKNINPQPLEVVIYILQVIKIMFHTILMKKLYTTRLFWRVFPHFTVIFSVLNQLLFFMFGKLFMRDHVVVFRFVLDVIDRIVNKRPRRSGVFIVNFEHISCLVLVFVLLTLSR